MMKKVTDRIRGCFLFRQSKLTYGLAAMHAAIILSVLNVAVWVFENHFFVARPSSGTLMAATCQLLVCLYAGWRLWLLGFPIIDSQTVSFPQKDRLPQTRGGIFLILLASLSGAWFAYPWESDIMAVIDVLVALCGGWACYSFMVHYGAISDAHEMRWFKKMMIRSRLPYCMFRFLPQ